MKNGANRMKPRNQIVEMVEFLKDELKRSQKVYDDSVKYYLQSFAGHVIRSFDKYIKGETSSIHFDEFERYFKTAAKNKQQRDEAIKALLKLKDKTLIHKN